MKGPIVGDEKVDMFYELEGKEASDKERVKLGQEIKAKMELGVKKMLLTLLVMKVLSGKLFKLPSKIRRRKSKNSDLDSTLRELDASFSGSEDYDEDYEMSSMQYDDEIEALKFEDKEMLVPAI